MDLTVQSPTRFCSGFRFNSLYMVLSSIFIVIFYTFSRAPHLRQLYANFFIKIPQFHLTLLR
nr:MAG TPA: hypothetical protein [Caudoviricetes sp.]